MKYTTLLCSKQWKIEYILDDFFKLGFEVNTSLSDYLVAPALSEYDEEFAAQKQNLLFFSICGQEKEIPAVIRTFSNHYLVFLVTVNSEEDFKNFIFSYRKALDWADKNLEIPYHDEYYEIQEMNNQLINSQRALVKSNQRLKKVLKEIREANNMIALLEQDPLTGLYCSSAFYRKAKQKMAEHPKTHYMILVFDIVNFKLINEIWGRDTGDHFLQALAETLLGLDEKENGIFCRESADTFFIFMPEDSKFYDILHEEVAHFFARYPLPIQVSEKIGVYFTKGSHLSVEQMCDRAKLALDHIRDIPEVSIEFYKESLHEDLLLHHKLLDNIKKALAEHEFQLYLQPKIDMRSETAIGAEALIRWIHPENGFISPGQFIPVLEKEGLVYEVDQYIWEEACKILRKRKDMGLQSLPISINVARQDLYQQDLIPVLCGLLEKYDLPAKDLHLEIIERACVNDSQNIFPILSDLKKQGFCIEIDDFGTGESSLGMLADMPVDFLKLDRSFLVSAEHNKRYQEVIKYTISLAKTLDMQIISEGIETREQADFLLSVGCNYAQGFFFARPEPAKKFLEIP